MYDDLIVFDRDRVGSQRPLGRPLGDLTFPVETAAMQTAAIPIRRRIQLVVLVRTFQQESGVGIIFFFSDGYIIIPSFGTYQLQILSSGIT